MALITVDQAVEFLLQEDVVALPTETVYGLAGRIDSEQALKKIFAVKLRPSFDPLIVHVNEVRQARQLCREWPEIYDILTEAFWPGPLTVIAPKSALVSHTITAGLDSVAIRAPAHPVFRNILAAVGQALAAPSANRFGRTSPTTAAHVVQEFHDEVAVVEGGACTVGVESTVIRAEQLSGQWKIEVLRPGGISRTQIRTVLDDQKIDYELMRAHSNASPGHLNTHYQPLSPLIILKEQIWSARVQAAVELQLGITVHTAIELKLALTPQQAARSLYADLRKFGSDPTVALWVTQHQTHLDETWEPVWDRLQRASSVQL